MEQEADSKYKIALSAPAVRALRKLKNNQQVLESIRATIDGLKSDPRPHGCQKLTNADDKLRVRDGSYRIVYEVDDAAKTVTVHDVADRKDVYRR